MNNQPGISKYKEEALQLLNKRKWVIIFDFILLMAFFLFLIIGLVTLLGAIEEKFSYQTAAILLTFSLNFLIGTIVLWVIRKTVFDRRLKETESLIKKDLNKMNKINHQR